MLKAVIFDFDGVIVDTEPLHYRAFQEVLRPRSMTFTWEEYMAEFIGFDDRDAFREAYRRHHAKLEDHALLELVEKKAVVFRRLVADEDIQPYEGVPSLVASLHGTLPLAICSGALRSDIEPILERFEMTRSFDLVVTADDVRASKPDPESYRKAVEELVKVYPDISLQPGDCLAIEDTPTGMASAHGAGLAVLGVSNSYPAEKLKDASATVESLAEVTVDWLRNLLEG